MDAFTENILARARERQKILEGYRTGKEENLSPLRESNKTTLSEPNLTKMTKLDRKEVVSESNLSTKLANLDSTSKENNSEGNIFVLQRQSSKTRVSSDMPGSPGTQLKTLNINRDNFNMQIKLTSSENVRVEVEIEEASDNDGDNSDSGSQISESGLREDAKNRLKRLGKLYAGGDDADISSPIHRTEAKFYQNEENCKKIEEKHLKEENRTKKGLSKLADLAQTINQWDDDVSQPTRNLDKKSTPRKAWKPPAPQPPDFSNSAKSTPIKFQKARAPDPPVDKKQSPTNSSPSSPVKGPTSPTRRAECVEATPKQLKWDKTVLDTLDNENNKVKTALTTQLQKEVKPADTIPEEHEEKLQELQNDKTPNSPAKNTHKSTAIANRAALFETTKASPKNAKDPALLSLAERKALFEKNKGAALVPKAAFGMSAPVKVDTTMKASESKLIGATRSTVSDIKSKFQSTEDFGNNKKASQKAIEAQVVEKAPLKTAKKPAPKLPVQPKARHPPTIAAVHQAGGIASKMAALLESKSTISEKQIENNIKEQRQKEMDMLLNRFNRNKEVTDGALEEIMEDSESDIEEADEETVMINEKSPKIVKSEMEKRRSGGKRCSESDSPKVVSVLEDVKRIKVLPPKEGRLYPALSDIETATETETRSPSPDQQSSFEENNYDSDDPNTSFGREILQTVCKNQTPQKRPIYRESTTSDNSSVMDELDEILEELDEDIGSAGPTPPKHGRHNSPQSKHTAQPSHSFNYKSFAPSQKSKSHFQSPGKGHISPRQSIESSTYVVEGDSVLPLTHTVSFYRKQQNQAQTPVRQISRQPLIEESPQDVSDDDEIVQEKIKSLQEEVNKQQNIISQTSQALNLCNCTPEFSGSTEQVEAEKVLLVATHRRQAALHEIQRLKVEGTIRPQGQYAQNLPLEKGTLTISNIVLPLKQKYVTALAAAGGKGHHVVCLIKCGEQVVPTKLVCTVANNSKNPDLDLCVPGTVTLNNVHSDFTVAFEVYCLQAQEECLPHEVKYHINKKSTKGLTTPKKSKQDSRLLRPIKESPAGPQAVRSSSFAIMGYVVFSVQAVNKRMWNLNNTPSMSPLEGTVEMRINCELAVSIEHRGFLTMFEDVSGFGAWHRRWCLLKGHTLSYWKYPDDERKMAPIDTIDLKNCITKQTGPVSRDICARLHTFLLERERLARPQDKDTLVMICKGDKTVIRHLLSADTKEERIEWCYKFNAALMALRMWGNNQQ